MNQSLELMMEEHRLIVEVLAALHCMAEKLTAGGSVERSDVAGFGRFFREFADQCHHGKEEDRLFVKMMEAGFPRESGPIAVMLAEHDDGRQEVRGLIEFGAGSGPLTNAEKARLLAHVAQFVPLLYGHIQKEDNILYPMAQHSVSPEELVRLDESCAAFDIEIRKKLEVEGLKQLAAKLVQRFPATPASLEIYGGCGACHAAG